MAQYPGYEPVGNWFVGLGRIYHEGYLGDRNVLLEPDWQNETPNGDLVFTGTKCIAYNGEVTWTGIEPHASNPFLATARTVGTYAFYNNVGGAGGPMHKLRRLGDPPDETTALTACCNADYGVTEVGAHQKNRMNILYDGGHVRSFTDILLAHTYASHRSSSGQFWAWAKSMDE